MMSWAPSVFAASTTSSSVASARPNLMFSPTVPVNRKLSWVTMPICLWSDSIHCDAALLRLVKAGQQTDDARLSGAGRADQRHGLAGFRLETNVFENPRAGWRGVVAQADL